MSNIKACSTCHQLPKLHIRHYGRTMTDPTIVSHFMYQCDTCTEKYINVDGTCHSTFEWHTEEKAKEEWNGIVDNNNSWYTKEYQQAHPLKSTQK